MAKPIFIVQFKKLPASQQYRDDIASHFKDLKEDYHVFITFSESGPGDDITPKFQLFSDKEIDPIDIEQLKKIVNEKI